ncbi:MAG: hypothetical protein GX536_01360 [Actinobacteria bacterium]|nr:hypothetical protein [Actinomycetota bacterium]
MGDTGWVRRREQEDGQARRHPQPSFVPASAFHWQVLFERGLHAFVLDIVKVGGGLSGLSAFALMEV